MGFEEADHRYAELKRQLDAGSISDEEFDTQRKQLMVQDGEGRWWAKGRRDGGWYYHSEAGWVKGSPPGYQPPSEAPPAEIAPEPRRQPEQAAPSASQPREEAVVGGGTRRQGLPPWVLAAAGLVVIALVGVGLIVWVLAPNLQGQGSEAASVPDVVGMSQGEAEESLRSARFEVEAEARESSEEEKGMVLEQEPAGGSEAESNSTVAIAVGGGPPPEEQAREPAPGFELVEHDAGNLSVEVPTAWGQRLTGLDGTFEGADARAGEGIGPALTASTDLNAWQVTGDPVPGTFMVASRELTQEFEPGQLADSGFNDRTSSCEPGESQDFNRGSYSGRLQTWNCGGDGSILYTLGAAPEGGGCVVMMQIKTFNEADREAALRILDTFEADCEKIQ